ncbi:hypothetical protein DWZ56_04560 [Lachnotalea sp. AF33-28]|nr:hypothetical protein DWZ56_04560 [Lachnotalea sp. AF33-28]
MRRIYQVSGSQKKRHKSRAGYALQYSKPFAWRGRIAAYYIFTQAYILSGGLFYIIGRNSYDDRTKVRNFLLKKAPDPQQLMYGFRALSIT